MIAKRIPQKVRSVRGTEFEGAFQQPCAEEGIFAQATESETNQISLSEKFDRSNTLCTNTWNTSGPFITKTTLIVGTINSRVRNNETRPMQSDIGTL